MSLEIYKKGQGYWTRAMSAVGFGFLIIAGGIWFGRQFQGAKIGGMEPLYAQVIAGFLFVAPLAALTYYLIARKPRVVDFMVATEGEMKKVNWSSWEELRGSTMVVIGLTVMLALLCFAFDSVFFIVFEYMKVIETSR